MTNRKTLVWLRQDLRIKDNPALYEAAEKGDVIALYIYDDKSNDWEIGEAQKWWLHKSLESLQTDLTKNNIRLILRSGKTDKILNNIIKETSPDAIYWNRCYEPQAIKRDSKIKENLSSNGIEVKSFNGSLLFEPMHVKNKSGEFFKVFTPFWKSCLSAPAPREVLGTPKFNNQNNYADIMSEDLNSWQLLPTKPNWASRFAEFGSPGEKNVHEAINNFIDNALKGYASNRDIPGIIGTSRISAHLHFGEISPNIIWEKIHAIREQDSLAKDIYRYLAEIGWREFSYHLLYHNKNLSHAAFNKKFDQFPWADNKDHFSAWKKGQTGYPIVDAGMRELWHTGWMHNRVRMIVASFLTKHLLIHWKKGADWFLHTLLDADLANNSAGWQWVAGCGADAAPYFRIFNPIIQGAKFDSKGEYIKKWVPEIANLPDKYIHCPWEASEEFLHGCGVKLGKDYPKPIVDHATARNVAMAAYGEIKR